MLDNSKRSFRVRTAALTALLLAGLGSIAIPTAAQAETSSVPGTISGKVTLSAGMPKEWLGCVGITATAATESGYASVDPISGNYEISGLAAGSYTVQFATQSWNEACDAANLRVQYWGGAENRDRATRVSVSGSAGAKSINAQMQAGRVISGTVKAPAGVSVSSFAQFSVIATPLDVQEASVGALVKPDGSYRIPSLSSANYQVQFLAPEEAGLAPGFFNRKTESGQATPVNLRGGDGHRVDHVFARGSSLSGTVSGLNRTNNDVHYLYATSLDGETVLGHSEVAANGSFNIGLLPAGDFRLRLEKHPDYDVGAAEKPHHYQFLANGSRWSWSLNAGQKLQVNLTAQQDSAVAARVSGGLDASGANQIGESAAFIYQRLGSDWVLNHTVWSENADGKYTSHRLPAGDYRVAFGTVLSSAVAGSATQIHDWFDSKTNHCQATTIALARGQQRTGVTSKVSASGVKPALAFSDVKTSGQFFCEISWMAEEGISTGSKRADGTFQFRPKDNVTREAMAAFLFRLHAPANYKPTGLSPFTDVRPGHKFYTEIMWAYEQKITTGIRSGSALKFDPKAPITREAMAAFMYRVYKDDLTATGGSRSFTDVPRSHKFHTHISWMAANGITTGSVQSNGSYQFRPKANTSREATAAFLSRAEK